ncbi:MAG: preprotein translocase subunit SecE [Chloroflexota bacterium]
MSADKTAGEDQQTGRRRRSLVARNRPVEEIEQEDDDEVVEERGITPGKGRATPSRRRQEEDEDEGNLATRTVGGLRGYIDGVRSELDKVVWPTREEWRRLTVIVLVTLVVSSLVLGTISLTFTELFRLGLSSPIVLLLTMVIGIVAGLFILRWSHRTDKSSY